MRLLRILIKIAQLQGKTQDSLKEVDEVLNDLKKERKEILGVTIEGRLEKNVNLARAIAKVAASSPVTVPQTVQQADKALEAKQAAERQSKEDKEAKEAALRQAEAAERQSKEDKEAKEAALRKVEAAERQAKETQAQNDALKERIAMLEGNQPQPPAAQVPYAALVIHTGGALVTTTNDNSAITPPAIIIEEGLASGQEREHTFQN